MTEQQSYEVLDRRVDFELRRYPAHLVAQVEVEAPFEEAANRAFRTLADYIFGANRASTKIGMTAPVLQQPAGERIGVTVPVLQAEAGASGRHVVSFVMPSSFSLATLPTPTDRRVQLREVSTELGAARRFSGLWREQTFADELNELTAAVQEAGFVIAGPPRGARFDPPWKPWLLCRNEVIVPVLGDRTPVA